MERKGRDLTDKKGGELMKWARRKGLMEIGKKEHTRKQGLEFPSKIDLIFTKAQATAYPPQEIANSDHSAISAMIPEKVERRTTKEKANFRKCDWDTVRENMRKEKSPETAEEFQDIMDKEIKKVPSSVRNGAGAKNLPPAPSPVKRGPGRGTGRGPR